MLLYVYPSKIIIMLKIEKSTINIVGRATYSNNEFEEPVQVTYYCVMMSPPSSGITEQKNKALFRLRQLTEFFHFMITPLFDRR